MGDSVKEFFIFTHTHTHTHTHGKNSEFSATIRRAGMHTEEEDQHCDRQVVFVLRNDAAGAGAVVMCLGGDLR